MPESQESSKLSSPVTFLRANNQGTRVTFLGCLLLLSIQLCFVSQFSSTLQWPEMKDKKVKNQKKNTIVGKRQQQWRLNTPSPFIDSGPDVRHWKTRHWKTKFSTHTLRKTLLPCISAVQVMGLILSLIFMGRIVHCA